MHAFLLTGDYEDFVKDKFPDYFVQEFPFGKISDTRELNNFVRLKLTQKTVIILKDFDKATEDAQNAFLKALEEPQENLIYVLTANNFQSVLPTIISRCEIIETVVSIGVSDKDRGLFSKFIEGKVGERLSLISKISKREDAINFTDSLIIGGHKMFLEKPTLVSFLDEANKLKSNLSANGNVQLQLTNFVVNLNLL